jgi:SAM-dependent methyltransferase
MPLQPVDLERDASPFVRTVVQAALPEPPVDILDIPCGYGRHALWLSQTGHRVTGMDIAAGRIEQATAEANKHGLGGVRFLIGDASEPLPFEKASFDLALIVHFAGERLITSLTPLLRPHGLLAYETFGGQGRNWRELPKAGEVRSSLTPRYQLLHYKERPVGPAKEAVAVTVLARLR